MFEDELYKLTKCLHVREKDSTNIRNLEPSIQNAVQGVASFQDQMLKVLADTFVLSGFHVARVYACHLKHFSEVPVFTILDEIYENVDSPLFLPD